MLNRRKLRKMFNSCALCISVAATLLSIPKSAVGAYHNPNMPMRAFETIVMLKAMDDDDNASGEPEDHDISGKARWTQNLQSEDFSSEDLVSMGMPEKLSPYHDSCRGKFSGETKNNIKIYDCMANKHFIKEFSTAAGISIAVSIPLLVYARTNAPRQKR